LEDQDFVYLSTSRSSIQTTAYPYLFQSMAHAAVDFEVDTGAEVTAFTPSTNGIDSKEAYHIHQ
jgi:hypothetical protein